MESPDPRSGTGASRRIDRSPAQPEGLPRGCLEHGRAVGGLDRSDASGFPVLASQPSFAADHQAIVAPVTDRSAAEHLSHQHGHIKWRRTRWRRTRISEVFQSIDHPGIEGIFERRWLARGGPQEASELRLLLVGYEGQSIRRQGGVQVAG
jgi:hypothetical protein